MWQKIKKARLLLILFFWMMSLSQIVFAAEKLSLELHNVNLSDALHSIAKFLHFNIVLSPTLRNKNVSLHLENASASEALELLLVAQGLAKWRVGNIYFIAPQLELVKRKEAELKLQEIIHETAPLVTRVWQIHYAKAEDIARLLQDANYSLLSKRGHVRVDSRTNILCAQDTELQLYKIQNLIKHLDVPVRQVLIETRLASVDSDFERELGINFEVQQPENTQHENDKTLFTAGSSVGRYSLAIAHLADGSLLDIKLSILEKEGHGELISSPSLFTANQQTASIEAGEEIPYQETSNGGGTTIAFKKAVLSLKVTPQIMPGNKVLLQLQINQDKPSSRVVLGVPAISTRQITTSILVNHGQTIVLGGIYEVDKEYGEQRVPFLGKIPLVGLLFQQHNVRKRKRELLIFVTPKIIRVS